MKRSGRGPGSRQRVEAARRQAALALGRDPDQRDIFVQPKSSPPPLSLAPETLAVPVASTCVGVLTVGEATARLAMSRAQLNALIARGVVETLPIEFGRVVPTREVERLRRAGS